MSNTTFQTNNKTKQKKNAFCFLICCFWRNIARLTWVVQEGRDFRVIVLDRQTSLPHLPPHFSRHRWKSGREIGGGGGMYHKRRSFRFVVVADSNRKLCNATIAKVTLEKLSFPLYLIRERICPDIEQIKINWGHKHTRIIKRHVADSRAGHFFIF